MLINSNVSAQVDIIINVGVLVDVWAVSIISLLSCQPDGTVAFCEAKYQNRCMNHCVRTRHERTSLNERM